MSVQELVQFLGEPNAAPIALEHTLPFTLASAGQASVFAANDMAAVRDLQKLAEPGRDTERNALTALINLSDNSEIRAFLGRDILKLAARIADDSQEKHSALLSMLLLNLCHDASALKQFNEDALTGLALKFASDLGDQYDYIALVFAEVARHNAVIVAELLPGLYPQLMFDREARRAGIAAAIKNCLFDEKTHKILAGEDSDLIDYIMITLKGPEEIDPKDLAEIPETISRQFTPEKKREESTAQQLILVECLVLLSGSAIGRKALRDKHAYYIIRELHLSSKDGQVLEACERYVNQVMRGDPEQNQIKAKAESEISELD